MKCIVIYATSVHLQLYGSADACVVTRLDQLCMHYTVLQRDGHFDRGDAADPRIVQRSLYFW